jgi:hypothetical protein
VRKLVDNQTCKVHEHPATQHLSQKSKGCESDSDQESSGSADGSSRYVCRRSKVCVKRLLADQIFDGSQRLSAFGHLLIEQDRLVMTVCHNRLALKALNTSVGLTALTDSAGGI